MSEAYRVQLKCDACGHQEPVTKISAEYIGKPCPACGANLLTEQDFEAAKALEPILLALHAAGLTKAAEGDGDGEISINPHAGALNVKADFSL